MPHDAVHHLGLVVLFFCSLHIYIGNTWLAQVLNCAVKLLRMQNFGAETLHASCTSDTRQP